MVIVFDGVCNFCNRWVAFVIRRDRQRLFRFAAAQSAAGRQLMHEAGLAPGRLDTLVLVDGDRHFERSDAILRVLERLEGGWSVLRLLRLAPRWMRDGCYDAFARRRYRLFGRTDACQVPDAAIRDRFLA